MLWQLSLRPLRQVQGFIAYYWIDAGKGVMASLSVPAPKPAIAFSMLAACPRVSARKMTHAISVCDVRSFCGDTVGVQNADRRVFISQIPVRT